MGQHIFMDDTGLLHDFVQQGLVQHHELCVSVLLNVLALHICIHCDPSVVTDDQPNAWSERCKGDGDRVALQDPAVVDVFRARVGERQHGVQIFVRRLHSDDQEHDAGDDVGHRVRHWEGTSVHVTAGHRPPHQLGSGDCVRGRVELFLDRVWTPALCHVF